MIIDNINGVVRHNMTKEQLDNLYKAFENFIADCTLQECYDNEKAIKAIETLIHNRMKNTK